MKQLIKPSGIAGTITAPASKSAMQRACAAALIKKGTTYLHNPGKSADDLVAIDLIRRLGATVASEYETLIIKSKGIHPQNKTLDCGESGLSIRMFTPIAALSDEKLTITGSGSLVKRPLLFFNQTLPLLEVECVSDGHLPLQIKGPLQPRNIEINGSLSSQFLTGLLFAYSAAEASDVTISVNDLNSKPYVDLTLELLAAFGLKTPINTDYKKFYFPQKSTNTFENEVIRYVVEGDWSGASFLLVAGAIAGSITVTGLNMFSSQADKAIIDVLKEVGANVTINENAITVSKGDLLPFEFDATDSPDLFPPLVALAVYCNGKTVLKGTSRLAHKESNRAVTLQEEFGKMGVKIELQNNEMWIYGTGKVLGAHVFSHNDHRVAMACAVAALGAESEMEIDGTDAVNKSYPDFWQDLVILQNNH